MSRLFLSLSFLPQVDANIPFHEWGLVMLGNKSLPPRLYVGRDCFWAKESEESMANDLAQRCRTWLTSAKNLKTGWIITVAIVGVYVGVIRPNEFRGGINNSKATGLASQPESLALWQETGLSRAFHSRKEIAADRRESVDKVQMAGFLTANAPPPPPPASQGVEADRKMVRTSSLDLAVQKPAEAAEKIRSLAERMGGYLVDSHIFGGEDATNGTLSIRVPADRFEEVRAEIRKLGLRVESDRIEAQDMTRQYVDQQAGLRNLRAEEAQYLMILKQAKTVKDTMDVSEKLGEIRGQIDQQQAEFEALSKQIETVAITISLRSEAEAKVFGLNWRPLYQIKLAARDGLDGLGNYASSMTGIVFLLPTILLWMITIIAGAAAGWRILRWVARRVFGWGAVQKPATA